MKRLLSLLLIFALLLMQAPFALAADSAQAVTMRLEAMEGKVSLHNQRKKSITCRAGIKLLSGYTISTEAASYAYVSLDQDKAIKLDGLSTASIQKKGKKLELLLSSGKLFFNVKVPLKADETMEIRTSTMVTGIRGTAGVLECLSPDKSQLLLLSGQVEVSSYNPANGQTESVSIHAGQRATFLAHNGTDKPEVLVAELTPADIPAAFAAEIAQDPALQAEISAQSKLPLNDVLKQADGLTQEKSAQIELQKKSETKQNQQKQTESTANERPSGSSGSGSSGGGSSGGDVTPEPPKPEPPKPDPPDPEDPDPEDPDPEDPDPEDPDPENPDPEDPDPENPDPEDPDPENPDPEDPDPENPDPEDPDPEDPDPEDPDPDPPHSDTTTLDAVTDVKKINEAFQNFEIVQLSGECNTKTSIQVPYGKTLRLLQDAKLIADSMHSLNIQGTFDNEGAVSLHDSSAIIIQGGCLNNAGSIHLGDRSAITCINETNELRFSNSGTVTIEQGASLICTSRFINSGVIDSKGGFFVARNLVNSGTIPLLSMDYYVAGQNVGVLDDDDDDERHQTSKIYANNLSELLDIVSNNVVLTLTSNLPSDLIGTVPSIPEGKKLTLDAGVYQIDLGDTTLSNLGTLTLEGSGDNNHLIGTGTSALLHNSGTLQLQRWNMHATKTALASIDGSVHVMGGIISSDSTNPDQGYALDINSNTTFSFRQAPLIRAKSQNSVFANGFPTGATITPSPDGIWFHMVPPNNPDSN